MDRRDEADRVRAHTPPAINARIDHCAAARIEDFATRSSADVDGQIDKLDFAWSLDRVVGVAFSGVALAGVALTALDRRLGAAIAGVATLSMLQYATTGGGLGVGILRRLGLRTRREIESERCALKALRGDFELVCNARSPIAQAGNALQAALR